MKREPLLVLLAAGASIAALGGAAEAGAVSASADTMPQDAPATGGNARTSLFAFSRSGERINQSAQYQYLPGGTVQECTAAGPLQCPSPAPSPPSPPGLVTYIVAGGEDLGPAVGVRNQIKPNGAVFNAQAVQSRVFSPGGLLQARGRASYSQQTGLIAAEGEAGGPAQRAAGAAFDPFTLTGPLTFPNYQYILDASLQTSAPGDWAGITYFAVDSRLTNPATAYAVDNFYGVTEPLNEALWSLTIVDRAPLESLSDLMDPSKLGINFQVNPAAIRMGILTATDSEGDAYTASELDAAIDGSVRADLTLVGGAAAISSFDLFPEAASLSNPAPPLEGETVYSVSEMVRYGDAVNAGVITAPEPSTWAMMAAGFAGLGWLRVRAKAEVLPSLAA
jgi:hypothetical protein